MSPDFESRERSELADFDDHTDFEGFLFEQASRGVQIAGSQRDRLRNVVYLDSSDNEGVTPVNVQLSTERW